jgi:hypothetical protein
MGRVVAFALPTGARRHRSRYPRYEEITGRIDQLAADLFDTASSLEDGTRLYGELETRVSPATRELLAAFYEAMLAHEEKFKHAAYLVGLQAGSGQLDLPVPLHDERATPDADA